jgi:hypothetical protein
LLPPEERPNLRLYTIIYLGIMEFKIKMLITILVRSGKNLKKKRLLRLNLPKVEEIPIKKNMFKMSFKKIFSG